MTQEIATFPNSEDPAIRRARLELTAAFRWTARLDMHEGVANHFSLAVSDDGRQFLMNPSGRHFARMKASDLLLLDAEGDAPKIETGAADPTAWEIHGAMHRLCPQARCVLHLHPRYARVVSTFAEPRLPMIEQNGLRFFNRVAVDRSYDGLALDDSIARIGTLIGDKRVLLLANHGVVTVGESVAAAFDEMYYFERACETVVLAMATGRALKEVPDEVAEMTAQQSENYPVDSAGQHFAEIMAMLDAEEPDYRD